MQKETEMVQVERGEMNEYMVNSSYCVIYA